MGTNSLRSLYLITDRNQTLGRPLVNVIEQALEEGVRFVQLREKDLSGRELFKLAEELRKLTRNYGAKLLINDRVDVAVAVKADGVHLGNQSMPVQEARRAFTETVRKEPVVGISTHSLKEAQDAERDGADLITFGPVYFTPSKAAYGQPLGIENLKKVAKAVNIPVFALGGIKKENIQEALNAGAFGVAMISAIMTADDVKKATGEIVREIAAAHRPQATDYKLL